MAFSSTDLTAIDSAIAGFASTGELRVRFADREVLYRSVDELQKLRALIVGELNATTAASAGGRPKQRIGVASRGL